MVIDKLSTSHNILGRHGASFRRIEKTHTYGS